MGIWKGIDATALIKRSKIGEKPYIRKDCVIVQSVLGNRCEIEQRNSIYRSSIGDMTYTGSNTTIIQAYVGKYCCISRQVNIDGAEHNYLAASMFPGPRLKNTLGGRITNNPEINTNTILVGNDVWIGQGASILRKGNLVVGDGAVIGAGAVVTKSIPPYAIAVGIPARVVKLRFPEPMIEKLLEIRWWDWPEDMVLQHWDLLGRNLDKETLEKLLEITESIKMGKQ